MLLTAVLLSSCNLAPHYNRPSSDTPSTFKEAASAPDAAWKPAEPRDAAARTKWWELYGDPVLNDLEKQVQASNQSLIAAEASYREARALVTEARAGLFPTVTTSPAYTAFRSSENTRGASAGGQTTGTGISTAGGGSGQLYTLPAQATYEVDLWGRIRNTVAVNADNAQASAGDLANAHLSLQAQLAQDYFQLRAVDDERRVLDRTVVAYRQALAATQNLFRNGIDSEIDVAQAQVQLDSALAQATDLGATRAQYEHALAVLVGKAPANFALAPGTFAPVLPEVPPMLPSQLLERRPDIAAAERRAAAANAQIGVARAAYFPKLGLSATGGFESSHFANWLTWPSRFWTLGPQATATLLDFGARRGQNEQARAAYDQAVANYRQTVLTAFQGVEDNLTTLRVLATEAEERRTAVRSARHYLALAQTRFQNGIDSYLNIAIAQTTLLTNEENDVQVRLRQVLASVALVMAMGGGWEQGDLPRH